MSEIYSTALTVRLTPQQIRAIDEWRLNLPMPLKRPDAIRNLIQIGLAVQTDPKAPPPAKKAM